MTTTAFRLKYADNVGFCADMGGRGFMMPTAMVIRDDGLIFVVSRSNTTARNIIGIQKVTRNHDYFGQIGTYGNKPGQMIWPTSLALDSEDNLYLADEFLHRITIFDRDGNLVSTWGKKGSAEGEIDSPSGILFNHDDNLVMVDHRNNRIQKFTRDGRFISAFGSAGDGDGQFNLPWGIAQDKQGNLYVADWRNDRIQKFTKDGEFLAKFGTSGDGDGQFNRPSGVGVDSEGNIYVADWGNQRVQVLDPEGRFLTKLRGEAQLNPWALEYLDAQQDENRARQSYKPVYDVDTDDPTEVSARIEPYFWDPVTVALDDEDRAYVLETCRHRFQIYERA
jgi:DNA-binding beta-propeller fold protein YncE